MKARTLVVVALLVVAACGGRTPTTPSSPPTVSPSPSPPPGGPSNPQPVAFEMSGVVTDDTGARVSGARVTVLIGEYGGYYSRTFATTDPSGRYQVSFNAVPGSGYYRRDPPGIAQAVGILEVEAPGFERFGRHILGTAPQLVENVRVHRVRRMTAGESATVTMMADDTVCIGDVWPGRELICGILRVVPPVDGTMIVEAVSADGGSAHPGLWVWGNGTGDLRQNPVSLPAVAGREYFVNVQMPWGFSGTQSFVVKTSYLR